MATPTSAATPLTAAGAGAGAAAASATSPSTSSPRADAALSYSGNQRNIRLSVSKPGSSSPLVGPMTPTTQSAAIAAVANNPNVVNEEERKQIMRSLPTVEELLKHPGKSAVFCRFCKAAYNEENPLFCMSVQRYKALEPGSAAQLATANYLFNRYIRTNAPHQIPNAADVKRAITERIREGLVSADLFDQAVKIAVANLRGELVVKFFESPYLLNLELEGVLLHAAHNASFVKYAKNAFCEELPLFYHDVEHFRKLVGLQRQAQSVSSAESKKSGGGGGGGGGGVLNGTAELQHLNASSNNSTPQYTPQNTPHTSNTPHAQLNPNNSSANSANSTDEDESSGSLLYRLPAALLAHDPLHDAHEAIYDATSDEGFVTPEEQAAMIFDKYIRKGGEFELALPDAVRSSIKNQLAKDMYPIDLFHGAAALVMTAMRATLLPDYRKSQECKLAVEAEETQRQRVASLEHAYQQQQHHALLQQHADTGVAQAHHTEHNQANAQQQQMQQIQAHSRAAAHAEAHAPQTQQQQHSARQQQLQQALNQAAPHSPQPEVKSPHEPHKHQVVYIPAAADSSRGTNNNHNTAQLQQPTAATPTAATPQEQTTSQAAAAAASALAAGKLSFQSSTLMARRKREKKAKLNVPGAINEDDRDISPHSGDLVIPPNMLERRRHSLSNADLLTADRIVPVNTPPVVLSHSINVVSPAQRAPAANESKKQYRIRANSTPHRPGSALSGGAVSIAQAAAAKLTLLGAMAEEPASPASAFGSVPDSPNLRTPPSTPMLSAASPLLSSRPINVGGGHVTGGRSSSTRLPYRSITSPATPHHTLMVPSSPFTPSSPPSTPFLPHAPPGTPTTPMTPMYPGAPPSTPKTPMTPMNPSAPPNTPLADQPFSPMTPNSARMPSTPPSTPFTPDADYAPTRMSLGPPASPMYNEPMTPQSSAMPNAPPSTPMPEPDSAGPRQSPLPSPTGSLDDGKFNYLGASSPPASNDRGGRSLVSAAGSAAMAALLSSGLDVGQSSPENATPQTSPPINPSEPAVGSGVFVQRHPLNLSIETRNLSKVLPNFLAGSTPRHVPDFIGTLAAAQYSPPTPSTPSSPNNQREFNFAGGAAANANGDVSQLDMVRATSAPEVNPDGTVTTADPKTVTPPNSGNSGGSASRNHQHQRSQSLLSSSTPTVSFVPPAASTIFSSPAAPPAKKLRERPKHRHSSLDFGGGIL